MSVPFSVIILALATALYLIAGGAFIYEKKYALSLTYVAYAVANIGVLILSLKDS